MKQVKDKIVFEEEDIKVLSRLKEMETLVAQMRVISEKAFKLKNAAFAEVELFCSENNIEYESLQFDDKDNSIILHTKLDFSSPMSGLNRLLKDILGDE